MEHWTLLEELHIFYFRILFISRNYFLHGGDHYVERLFIFLCISTLVELTIFNSLVVGTCGFSMWTNINISLFFISSFSSYITLGHIVKPCFSCHICTRRIVSTYLKGLLWRLNEIIKAAHLQHRVWDIIEQPANTDRCYFVMVALHWLKCAKLKLPCSSSVFPFLI